VFAGVLNPIRLIATFRLGAARKRYQRRPGPEAALALARLLERTGDRAGAMGLLQKARARFPRSSELKRLHDTIWEKVARQEIAILERSLRSGGRVEDAARLIELYRSLKEYDRSLANAQEWERKVPESWLLKLAKGKALYHRFLAKRSKDDGQKAVEALRASVRIKPGCARALLYLAALLAELGRRDEALSAAEDLVAVAPGNERATRLRAKLLAAKPSPAAKDAAARRAAKGTRARSGADPEVLEGLLERLKAFPSIYGALIFDPEFNVILRHALPNEHFAIDGHEASVALLAKAARASTERIGIGGLNTCSIEGDPWRIHLAEITGGTLAVLSNKAFDAGQFEQIAGRFTMDLVSR